MPVDRDIRLLEHHADDPTTVETVQEIVLPRMLAYRKALIHAARSVQLLTGDHDYEGMLTDAARVRLAVIRFLARERQRRIA